MILRNGTISDIGIRNINPDMLKIPMNIPVKHIPENIPIITSINPIILVEIVSTFCKL